MNGMSFKEALKKLNIEDYGERIFNSNSHGELFHLMDYILLAQSLSDASWFREWFVAVVAQAEQEWKRPESVFQHITKILQESVAADLGWTCANCGCSNIESDLLCGFCDTPRPSH